jgi:hypothetical protein
MTDEKSIEDRLAELHAKVKGSAPEGECTSPESSMQWPNWTQWGKGPPWANGPSRSPSTTSTERKD